MKQRIHRSAAILFLLPVIAAANTGIIQVTGVRAWSRPEATRVILEVSGPAEYKADRAYSPDRLFFDVLNARPLIDGRRIATRDVNDRLVKRVRVAETAPGTTRIVFDLNAAVDYKISSLDTPDRLVIELTPAVRGSGPEVLSRVSPQSNPQVTPQRAPKVSPLWVPRLKPLPVIALPDPAAPVELASSLPLLPEFTISFSNVKVRRAGAASSTTVVTTSIAPPSAPPVWINTTTKVLPAAPVTSVNRTAKASSDASLSLTRALGLKINRIVIDAGHGGHDDGTIGPHGVLEKDVVLDVALRLATLVQTRLGAEVVLTRSDDTFVPLTERTAIANDHKADLFLSIHANSSPMPSAAGTETYLLNLTTNASNIAVAARENAGSDKSVGELQDLVRSITLNDKVAESQNFAADIQSAIFAQAAKGNVAAHDRGVKKAPFVVLIGAHMPSVLAEIGFLSNPKDESNLGKPEYRQKIAESLYRGLTEYSQSLSHFEVAAK